MAAGSAVDPWRIFYQLSAAADTGRFSGGHSRMDRRSGVGGMVCLLLPGSNFIVCVLSE